MDDIIYRTKKHVLANVECASGQYFGNYSSVEILTT